MAGNISINGVAIKDINVTINVGDLITSVGNSGMFFSNVEGLLINQSAIFVKALPNVVLTTFTALNQEMLTNASGILLDPMTH
jgi:hypothetical protein